VLKLRSYKTRLLKKFRIIETTLRGESFYTVEYRTLNILFFNSWTPIMVCDNFDDAVRKINLVVNLKLNEE
jgi:hypothetical protein